MYMIMTYLAIYRKLISYQTGWYRQNLQYQCLGRKLISSSFPLFRLPLFLQPLHLLHLFLNMCLSLFFVLVHSLESRNKVVNQEASDKTSKQNVCRKKRMKKKKKTYNERLMGYNCKQDVWRWKKERKKKKILMS